MTVLMTLLLMVNQISIIIIVSNLYYTACLLFLSSVTPAKIHEYQSIYSIAVYIVLCRPAAGPIVPKVLPNIPFRIS